MSDAAAAARRFGLTYAQARLRLGMAGVGLWVLVSLALLATTEAPHPLRALGGYLALSFPLDLLGGQILPRLWRRDTTIGMSPWTGLYLRGLALHSGLLAVGLTGVSLAYRWAGVSAATGLYVLGALLLLRSQVRALQFLGASLERRDGVLWLATYDFRFSGGLSGLPGSEEIVLPAHWQHSPVTAGWRLHLERHRGLQRSGSRALGCGLGIAFTAAGLAWTLPVIDGDPVKLAAAMTLWSFLGLLLLPSLSRPGVHYADALCQRDPVQKAGEVWDWLAWLERWQEEDEVRSPWVERIFHPVPSWSSRRALRTARFFPWNAARTALWTSVLAGGLLSRAVHCNSGRPELWFWPPTD